MGCDDCSDINGNLFVCVSLNLDALDAVVETLPLEVLSELSLGLFYCSSEDYQLWMSRNRELILERFHKEKHSVLCEDDGKNLRTHFFIKLFQPGESLQGAKSEQITAERKFLNASMTRLRLLRGFFPGYECYGSRGYGHLISINADLNDDTKKDIPAHNFPLQPLVRVNSIFRALGEQPSRPKTWEVYAQSVMQIRKQVLKAMQHLSQKMNVYFRKTKVSRALNEYVRSDEWKQTRLMLETSPMLPYCAFDEWGFVSESHDRRNESDQNISNPNQSLAFEKYRFYVKAFNEYIRTCSNFFKQAEWVLVLNPELKGENAERIEEIARDSNVDLNSQAYLSTVNLGDAWKALSDFQDEFGQTLAQFFEKRELSEMERTESEMFSSFWKMWYFFAFNPTKPLAQASKECTSLFKNKVKEVRGKIKTELQTISSDAVKVEIFSEEVQWEKEAALWIKVDGGQAVDVYQAIEVTVESVKKAIHSVHDNLLRRYATKCTWPDIVIVPLVKSSPLDKNAWKFPSDLLSVDPNFQMKWWNFVPVEIPQDAFSYLSLSPWNHPRLSTIKELRAAISELYLLSSHIKDFERLPDLDTQGYELLQSYTSEFVLTLSKSLQKVLDKTTEALAYFTGLPPEQVSTRPYLELSIQALVRMHRQVLPGESQNADEQLEVSMNLEELCEWVDQLNLAQQSAFEAYLFWVSDFLEEIAEA